MSGYQFTDRQLRSWPPAAAAAALWERATSAERSAAYWKHRAITAEQTITAQEDRK